MILQCTCAKVLRDLKRGRGTILWVLIRRALPHPVQLCLVWSSAAWAGRVLFEARFPSPMLCPHASGRRLEEGCLLELAFTAQAAEVPPHSHEVDSVLQAATALGLGRLFLKLGVDGVRDGVGNLCRVQAWFVNPPQVPVSPLARARGVPAQVEQYGDRG